MPIFHFSVKRKRTPPVGKSRWVEMGVVTVNTDDLTGTLYLHSIDHDWKLFPITPRQVPDKD